MVFFKKIAIFLILSVKTSEMAMPNLLFDFNNANFFDAKATLPCKHETSSA